MVIKNGTCPMPPEASVASAVPITPIVSVTSVNGEIGDVVLRKLVVGDKEYNGYERIELEAKDLGLEKALKYVKATETIQQTLFEISNAELGDLFYCKENTLFYFVIAQGDYKTFGAGEHFDKFALAAESASKVVTHINEDFELTLDLIDRDGNKFFTSEPTVIPFEFAEIIKSGYYDAATKELVFVLANEKEIRIPVSGLISGLQKEITEEDPLAMRLVDGLLVFKQDIYDKYEAEVDARAEAVAAEAAARAQGDAQEKTERIANITSAVNEEKQAREAAVAEETTERQAADTVLRNDLTATNTGLTKEIADRKAADTDITAKIDLEIEQRKAADDVHTAAIATEKNERVTVDATLAGNISSVQTSLTNEINNRIAAVSAVQTNLDTEVATRLAEDQAIKLSLTEERNNRIYNDAQLKKAIEDETAARISADNVLATQFNDEAVERKAADDAEAAARKAADDILQQNITNEANTRESSDNAIRSDLATERANRISNYQENKQRVETEASTRADADIVLQANIDAEKTAREAADANLQNQINLTPVYSIAKDADPGVYAAVYHLTKQIPGQEAVNIGEPINIAKDYLVKSASVRKVESDTDPAHTQGNIPVGHTCIDFIINAKESPETDAHIYVDVTTLIDIYTGGYGITVENYNIRLSDEFTHRIATDEENLTAERNNRIAQDEILKNRIDTTDANLTTERNNRIANVQELNAVITAENTRAVARENEIETTLTTKINTDVAAEKTAREQADVALTNDYTAKIATVKSELTEKINTDIAAEQTARSNADTGLQNQILENATAIATEKIERQNSDAALLALINQILNTKTSFVTKISGTGAVTYFTVTHGLGTENVIVQVANASGATVVVDTVRTGVNTIGLTFKEAPAMGTEYTVMCYAIKDDLASVKVSFNANGGSGTMEDQWVVKGTSFVLPPCTMTPPAGKEFDKWAVGSASGTQYAVGTAVVIEDSTTMYACWKQTGGTLYYGAAPASVLTSKSIAALTALTSTQKTKEELLASGFQWTSDENVPVVAVANSLGITKDTFWTGNESYHVTPYVYTVDGYTFYCNSTDEGITPGEILGETLMGITFKSA